MTYCIVLPNEVSKHHFVPEKPLIDLREREQRVKHVLAVRKERNWLVMDKEGNA